MAPGSRRGQRGSKASTPQQTTLMLNAGLVADRMGQRIIAGGRRFETAEGRVEIERQCPADVVRGGVALDAAGEQKVHE